MPLKWIEVPPATFAKMRSTGQAQPLAREAWPEWARTSPAFTGAWFTYIGDLLATSTDTLSTEYARGYLDMERTAAKPPSRRYYRYDYVTMPDNRSSCLAPTRISSTTDTGTKGRAGSHPTTRDQQLSTSDRCRLAIRSMTAILPAPTYVLARAAWTPSRVYPSVDIPRPGAAMASSRHVVRVVRTADRPGIVTASSLTVEA
jgi:hypothetical protein